MWPRSFSIFEYSSSSSSESTSSSAPSSKEGPLTATRIRRPGRPKLVPPTTAAVIQPVEPPGIQGRPPKFLEDFLVTSPSSGVASDEGSLHLCQAGHRTRRVQRLPAPYVRRTFYEMWFVCMATLTVLVVPMGLILAPYLGYRVPIFDREETVSLRRVTPYPWVNVSESCLGKVTLNDNTHQLRTSDPEPAPSYNKTGKIFCLYNNSRYRKFHKWDYLPKHIPFVLCPYVVYWSMGIEEANVVSRVPEFDVRYGIWAIKDTSRKYLQGMNRSSKILVAIGGYLEDSAHFSRLGGDSLLMTRLAANVLKKNVRHKLDGITIHWKDMGGTCGAPDDFNTLRDFVRKLRKLITLNGLDLLITVIMETAKAKAQAPDLLGDLDYIFYETHKFNDSNAYRWCGGNLAQTIRFFATDVRGPSVDGKACFTASLGARISDLLQDVNQMFIKARPPELNISRVPGLAALFEMCSNKPVQHSPLGICRLFTAPIGSEVVRGKNMTIKRVYTFEKASSLHTRLWSAPGACVLVVDLDFDRYRGQCPLGTIELHNQIKAIWS